MPKYSNTINFVIKQKKNNSTIEDSNISYIKSRWYRLSVNYRPRMPVVHLSGRRCFKHNSLLCTRSYHRDLNGHTHMTNFSLSIHL